MTENSSKNKMTEQAVPPCLICGKPSQFATRPFCSKRCADIDLHRWLGGVYAIPAAAEPEEDAGVEDTAETS